MKSVWVFPGQGTQRKGMGAGSFERHAHLVEQADALLGYSLRELCLEDPRGVLDMTEYTQPALFAVSALAFLDRRDSGAKLPDYFAGHSLGEFTALFAAGAFDFGTGIALVAKRGELMSKAPRGAMAAVIGFDHGKVRSLLAANGMDSVDVANINSASQVVIAGPYERIASCERVFIEAGARFMMLKVSAAFHSRYMRNAQDEFERFIAERTLHPLSANVVSNRTARLYPRHDYASLLTDQITHAVDWYESISWLLSQGVETLEEIGPGEVLTNLFYKIRQAPAAILDDTARDAVDTHVKAGAAVPPTKCTVFMYSGQGSQYYAMGKELYAADAAFRGAMDNCNTLYSGITGRDMIAELFDDTRKWLDMTDVVLSHPALYSIGYSLTVAMEAAGVKPDCVLGYSLGEYVASAVAGVLTHEAAMHAVVMQALLLERKAPAGAMLSIISPRIHFEKNPEIYRDSFVASENFDKNFVVSGNANALDEVKSRLDAIGVPCVKLPVEYALHSPEISGIENDFREKMTDLSMSEPRLPVYSSATGGQLHCFSVDHYWDAIRKPVDFSRTIETISATQRNCRFVDLGPAGTLSSFIKHGFGDRAEHMATMNRFGRNAVTIRDAIGRLSGETR